MPPLVCCSCHVRLDEPLTRKLRITQLWPLGRDEFMCEACWIYIFALAAKQLYASLESE
jgi:hypothetical protein